jgi:hypothetical protein
VAKTLIAKLLVSSRTGSIDGIRAHSPAVLRGAQLVQERMRDPR